MAVPYDILLHPQLLTNEQLMLIIRERHLNIPNIENMRREELLEIFHQYCVPFGQRKYRDTGRGKLLNKNRKSSPSPPAKLNTFNETLYRKSLSRDRTDRLKPPPDTLSTHLKRIKLEIITTQHIPDNNAKRKLPIEHVDDARRPPFKKRSEAHHMALSIKI